MAVVILALGYTPSKGVDYTVITDTSADFAAVTTSTYLYNKGDNKVYYKDSAGVTNAISFATAVTKDVFGIDDGAGGYTYYATIALANAGAVSGDTIEMFSDVTETGAVEWILKDGVNYNLNGHTYTLSQAGTLDAMTDNAVSAACTLFNGTIIRTGGTKSGTNSLALDVDHASSVLSCTGMVFKSDFGSVATIDGQVIGGSYIAEGGGIIGGTNIAMYVSLSGGKASNFYAFSEWGYAARNSGGGIISNATIETENYYGTFGGGMYNNCSMYSSGNLASRAESGTYNNCSFRSDGSNAVSTVSGTNYYYNCTFYSTSGYGWFGGNSIDYLENCTGHSTSSIGLYNSFNTTEFKNCVGTSSANNGLKSVGNSDLIDGCIIESSAAAALFLETRIMHSVVKCTWNNASGHAVTGSGTQYTNVSNCYLETAHASANCLHYGSAISVTFVKNTYGSVATTPVNANISQAQTNTEDTYGNIQFG